MPSYLVEGYLARSRAAELTEAVARVRRAARTLSAEGMRVRHVRSTFLPEDELYLHTLEAESAEAAGEVIKRAGIAPERIAETVPVQTTEEDT